MSQATVSTAPRVSNELLGERRIGEIESNEVTYAMGVQHVYQSVAVVDMCSLRGTGQFPDAYIIDTEIMIPF